ncbi:hypothetical protein [Nocardia tengchongensis]
MFLLDIAAEMVDRYGIDADEAVARINERFIGWRFAGDGLLFHQSEAYWATDIYFGHDVWWRGEESVDPVPAPGGWQRWLSRRLAWQQLWRLRRLWWSKRLYWKHR